jgi:hypothetical protein
LARWLEEGNMQSIKLKVTSRVIEQSGKARNQEQIAISDPTGSLVPAIALATRKNRVRLVLGGAISLELGDTGAIWRVHNPFDEENFDALFGFLSKFPDTEVEFTCAVDSQSMLA